MWGLELGLTKCKGPCVLLCPHIAVLFHLLFTVLYIKIIVSLIYELNLYRLNINCLMPRPKNN